MKAASTSLFLVVFLLLAGITGYFLFGPGPSTAPVLEEQTLSDTSGEAPATESAPRNALWTGDDLEREAAEIPQEVAESPQADLAFSGRVLASGGGPVPGASVELALRQRRGRRGGWVKVPPVKTDAQGLFTFRARATTMSLWNILVVKRDFCPLLDSGVTPAVAGRVYLGDFLLGPGGVVEGSVLDPAGSPVAAAEVEFREERGRGRFGPWFGRGGLETPPLMARTDEAGRFQLRPVPRGEGRVQAGHPEFVTGRSHLVRMKDGARIGGVKITLQPAVGLTGVVRTEEGRALAGAEVSLVRSGRGVPDFNPGRGSGRGPSGRWDRDNRTETDQEGAFTFRRRLPGKMLVLARKEGYQPALEWLQVEAGQAPPSLTLTHKGGRWLAGKVTGPDGKPITGYAIRAVPVDLAPTDLAGNLKAPPGEELSGEADRGGERMQNILDRMRREGGRRLPPEAIERLVERFRGRGRGGSDLQGAVRQAISSLRRRFGDRQEHRNGEFRLEGLLPCKYRVEVTAPDYERLRSDPFDLRAAPKLAGLELTLEPVLVLKGRILDQKDRKPVAGARVMARAETEENATPALRGRRGPGNRRGGPFRGFGRMGFGRSDGKGEFRITGIEPGTYRIEASAEGHGAGKAEGVKLEKGKQADPVEIVLGGTGTITGRVLGLTGRESTSVIVGAVSRENRGRPTTSGVDREGRFTLEGLQPGEYYLRATAGLSEQGLRPLFMSIYMPGPGGDRPQPDVVVEEGKESRAEVTLIRTNQGSVRGTLFKGGVPAAGSRVRLQKKEERQEGRFDMARMVRRIMGGGSSEVDVAGGFVFDDVDPGLYTVNLEGRGGGAALGQVEVFPNQVSTVALNWEVGSIKGEVRHNGKPLAGATVLLSPGSGEEGGRGRGPGRGGRRGRGSRARTDGEGRFEVKELAAGSYTVQIQKNRRSSIPAGRIEVVPGRVNYFEYELKTGTADLLVAGADGAPIRRAMFSFTQGEGRPFRRAFSDEKGACKVEDLPGGELTVTCRARGFQRAEQKVVITPGDKATLQFLLQVDPEAGNRADPRENRRRPNRPNRPNSPERPGRPTPRGERPR